MTPERPTPREAYLRIGLGAAALFAAVLGYVGFWDLLQNDPSVEGGRGVTDILYFTLQLFLLDAAPLQKATNLPPVLEIARFLAPATTALTLGFTIKAVYDSTYRAVRARQLDEHTIVCGDGTPALLVARGVAAEGRTCVVVSASGTSSDPGPDDRAGAVLRIGGDPRSAAVLREARIDRASEVVVVTGDSARNTDVAAALRSALAGVDDPPRCFLEMSSPELAAALAAHEINQGAAVHLEFFDPSARAARRLLDAWLPFEGGSIVIVGAGETYDAVEADLHRRVHRAGEDIRWTSLTSADLTGYQPPPDLALTVVAVDEDVRAVQTGLVALKVLRELAVDVVVATRSSTALGSTITGEEVAVSTIGRARLHLFNTTDHVYALDSLRDGVYLDMARAAHEAYVARARERGETTRSNESTVPWGQLPEHLRVSNIEQARDIGAKLRASSFAVVPSDGTDGVFAFEGAELDRMARDEHDRWCREKRAAGWTPGPRDNESRKHPDLVPWDDLTAESRQKDRDAVAAIPDQLRRVGLQILRVGR